MVDCDLGEESSKRELGRLDEACESHRLPWSNRRKLSDITGVAVYHLLREGLHWDCPISIGKSDGADRCRTSVGVDAGDSRLKGLSKRARDRAPDDIQDVIG